MTPCYKCPKIPEGEPKVASSALELSAKNWAAYLHYLECDAVGRFPEDSIVRQNAAIIKGVMRDCEAAERFRALETIGQMISRISHG